MLPAGAGADYACLVINSTNTCALVAPPVCGSVPSVCPQAANLIVDGNFVNETGSDPPWTVTTSTDGWSEFFYAAASLGGALSPVGSPPQGGALYLHIIYNGNYQHILLRVSGL